MDDDQAYRLTPAAMVFTNMGLIGRQIVDFVKANPGLAGAINAVCSERYAAAEHETFEKMLHVLETLGHYDLANYFRDSQKSATKVEK